MTYYRSVVKISGGIIQQLLSIIRQYEAVDADTLKMSKLFLCCQVDTLKREFDIPYDKFLKKLAGVYGDIFQKCFGGKPSEKGKGKIEQSQNLVTLHGDSYADN